MVDTKKPATVLFMVGLQVPMVCRLMGDCLLVVRKHLEEAFGLLPLGNLLDLSSQAKVHPDEPSAANLIRAAAFSFPEIEFAELGGYDERKARAQTPSREIDLVKRNLAQVSSSTEHVESRGTGSRARPTARDNDSSEGLDKARGFLALPQELKLTAVFSCYLSSKELSIIYRCLSNLVAAPKVDFCLVAAIALKGVDAQVHAAFEENVFLVNGKVLPLAVARYFPDLLFDRPRFRTFRLSRQD